MIRRFWTAGAVAVIGTPGSGMRWWLKKRSATPACHAVMGVADRSFEQGLGVDEGEERIVFAAVELAANLVSADDRG